jgi:hypothetical protein
VLDVKFVISVMYMSNLKGRCDDLLVVGFSILDKFPYFEKYTRSSGKNYSPTFLDTTRAGDIENDASNNSIVARVFVTAVTYLPSRSLATSVQR